jgi:two-component system chemotaxis sensor kinase CheA
VLGVGGNRRMAVQLSAVSRLEEFDGSTVEMAGETQVVQYRNRILPLVRVASLLENPPVDTTAGSRLQVVVHEDENENENETVGLVVDQILDIVEEKVMLDDRRLRPGLMGSAIVQGRVTDVIDVPALLVAVSGLVVPA